MADGVVIPLDVDDIKARTKVAKLKRDAADAGREYGRAGSQAARLGGPGGGILGRALGGFNQSGTAGGVGLSLAALGLGVNAYLARDRERMEMAVLRETRQQGKEAIQRTVMERSDARSSHGTSFAGAARRMVSRGRSYFDISDMMTEGSGYGLTTAETLSVMDEAEPRGNSRAIMLGMATGLIGDTPSEVAGNIRKFNGLNNAIAAMNNMSTEEASESVDRAVTTREAKNIARGTAGMNPVSESQFFDLISGRTGDAIARTAADELDPGAKLMAEAAHAADDVTRQLLAAAEKQGAFAVLLTEASHALGLGEGSARQKLGRNASASSETSEK